MMVLNRRLVVGAALASLLLSACSGNEQNNSNAVSSATIDSSINLSIDVNLRRDGPASYQSGANSWWATILTNHRSKRKLSENINPVDKPHFIPEHRYLEFGDYVDPTFNCPATTTCYPVCVKSAADCPSDATCALANPDASDHEFEVCKDGTCADLTLGESCDPALESLCTCSGLTFTCAKQVDDVDSCHVRFNDYYDVNNECLEQEKEGLYDLEFRPVVSKLLYIPVCVITACMLAWCAYNQKFRPVERSNATLESHEGGDVEQEHWTQTGYKKNAVGMTLYVLVILLHLEFQVMLFFFSIEYCELP
jgi:outer membrane murein-binding lipoprotein Lpp